MRHRIFSTLLLVILGPASLNVWAQESGQSLGEIARKERERKKAQETKARVITEESLAEGRKSAASGGSAGADRQPVVSEELGLQLSIPRGWKASYYPISQELAINCNPGVNGSSIYITSSQVPSDKKAIMEADRQKWSTGVHPWVINPWRRLASRDFEVAGYPAYEILAEAEKGLKDLIRFVYILAPDAGRLYDFSFTGPPDGEHSFSSYGAEFNAVLESFSPLGPIMPTRRTAAEANAPAPSQEKGNKLKPKEEEAYMITVGIIFMEGLECLPELERPCTLDELIEGVTAKSGKKVGGKLERDIRRDPDYEYHIDIRGEAGRLEISAIPRRLGFGGFLKSGDNTYFNPNGPASTRDLVVGKDVPDPLAAKELTK